MGAVTELYARFMDDLCDIATKHGGRFPTHIIQKRLEGNNENTTISTS